MFGLTALELARIQFAFTMSSHIIFPAITIGLVERELIDQWDRHPRFSGRSPRP